MEYMLCDYVTGTAKNLDVVENVDALWAETADITQFIPADQIYEPVLAALSPAVEMPA